MCVCVCVCVCVYTYMCSDSVRDMTVQLWQLPMLLTSLVCALSMISAKLRPKLREREVVTFYEEDPEAPSVLDKALEAKKQLLDVQVLHM